VPRVIATLAGASEKKGKPKLFRETSAGIHHTVALGTTLEGQPIAEHGGKTKMRTVADSLVLVANVRSANVLADRPFRLLRPGTVVRVLAVGSTSTVRCRLYVGAVLFIDENLVNLRATAPEEDKDIVLQPTKTPGGEIILTFISPTADTVRWKVDILP